MSLTMDAPELAALLRVSLATLPGKVRRLQREHGFPQNLPRCPNTWSRARVEGWINDPDGTAPETPKGRERRIARDRQALEDRYAGGAHV